MRKLTPTPSAPLQALPDLSRRRLLRAGAAALTLPLLPSCGSSSSPVGGSHCAAATPGAALKPPRGLHVSWLEDPLTTRTVTWFTDGSDDPGSVIEYGPVEDGMSACQIEQAAFPMRAEGSAQATYGVDALTHIATARDLDPARPLRYRIGSDQGWSSVRVLPPLRQDGFRFCHFGDHALSEASHAVMTGVQKLQPDFLIIAGDLSYANGEQPVWDRYFDMLDPVASRLPIMTCPGNHENKDGGGAGYSTRVAQPGKINYYSYGYGRVHFCFGTGGSLVREDNPASIPEFLAELLWMELDLAKAALRRAAGEIDFIVFVQHYSFWTNCEGRDPGNFTAILLEEHMMLRYGVDLVLVGHDHIYERSKPMAYGIPLGSGYVQVTQGGGGQSLYELVPDIAGWSDISTIRHGFTEFVVEGRTIHGTTYSVENDAIELLPNGELQAIDRFEIHARGDAERASFAAARAKSKAEQEFDLDAMIRHTLERNRLHDVHEGGGLHS